MIKLYGGARSRASIAQWYLEELGIPYEFMMLDMQSGEHRNSEYLAINPMGKVPSIVDGDFKLWESGAILLYLAEKYGNDGDTLEKRSILNQWILFANSTLATGLFIEASRQQETPKLLTPLNQMFEQQPYILGDKFSAADVAVGSMLYYVSVMIQLDLSQYLAVLDYVKRMAERPAFEKTIGKR